tara:strand:+ start:3575 stop:3817 length:243 start_codon:yes stop_codon:yes gene_type:complete
MRRKDKLHNIEQANMLAEQRYLEPKQRLNELRDIPHDIKDDTEFYNMLRGVIKFGMDKWQCDAGDVWAAIASHSKFYGGR